MLFVIIAASFVLFSVHISLFWWHYLCCDVIKKALFFSYFNIVYYDVMSNTRLLMLRYFHCIVWTLHMWLVSFVLSEYTWCCVTKSVYNSSGILSPQVRAYSGFWITLHSNIEHSSSEYSFKALCHIEVVYIDIQAFVNFT